MSIVLTGILAGQALEKEQRERRMDASERPKYTLVPRRRLTMYALGEPPRGHSEAFDALDNVFGGEEFTLSEAELVLQEVLDMSSGDARGELNRMIRRGSIVEA